MPTEQIDFETAFGIQRPDKVAEKSKKPKTITITKPEDITPDYSFIDFFRDYLSPLARGGLVGVGMSAGSLVSPGAGTILGGMGGDLLYQQLQRYFPQLYGSPPQGTVVEPLTEAALSTGTQIAGGKVAEKLAEVIPTAKEELKRRIIQRFFKKDPLAEDVTEALLEQGGSNVPPLPYDVAQATQSPVARVTRDIAFPEETKSLFKAQQSILREQSDYLLSKIAKRPVDLETPSISFVKVAAQKAKGVFEKLSEVEDQLYNSLRERLAGITRNAFKLVKNPETNEIVPEAIPPVKGPVFLENTVRKAKEILEAVREVANDPTLIKVPAVNTALENLKAYLSKFSNTALDLETQKPIISFNAAQTLKTTLSDILENAPESVKARFTGSIRALRDMISKDIAESAERLWPQDAVNLLKRAFKQTELKEVKFGNQIAKKLKSLADVENANLDDVMNAALSSASEAKQFIVATGSKDEIGAEFAKRLIREATDANGFFHGSLALDKLLDKSDIAKVVLNAEQRAQLKLLFKRMQAVDPTLLNTGRIAFMIRYLSAHIGLSAGLLRAMSTGTVTQGGVTGGLIVGVVRLTRPILRNLLLDPKNARMAAELAVKPINATQPSFMKKFLKSAFQGAQMELFYPSGELIGTGVVNNDGEIVFDHELSNL